MQNIYLTYAFRQFTAYESKPETTTSVATMPEKAQNYKIYVLFIYMKSFFKLLFFFPPLPSLVAKIFL